LKKTDTGKIAEYNELITEDCPGVASVSMITYLRKQLALRDAKIVALEQRMRQLFDVEKTYKKDGGNLCCSSKRRRDNNK
jgi:hypothetical protein